MSRIDKNYFQERFSYSAEQNGSIFQCGFVTPYLAGQSVTEALKCVCKIHHSGDVSAATQ